MSPLTMPFKMTLGAATDPSMQPCSLTDTKVPRFESPLTLPLIWPSICRPPVNSRSPLIRVFGPIRVSTVAFLLWFLLCLNICLTLGRIAACLGFHRHPLRLPNEGLPKTVAHVSVAAAVNLHLDARGLEPLRQLYGFVVILKVTEGVCQADAPVRRHLAESQAGRFAPLQPLDGDHGGARHHALGLPGLHQYEFQAKLTGNGLGHDLHLLHLHVDDRIRLHQASVKRQVLVQARNLTLHVAEALVDLLVALLIDATRHFRGRQLGALLFIFSFETTNARARRERAAHGIDHTKTGVVSAEFKRRVQNRDRQQRSQADQHRTPPRRMRPDDQITERIHHTSIRYHPKPRRSGNIYALAQGISCHRGGHLVRGPVLSASPVRLSRDDMKCLRSEEHT